MLPLSGRALLVALAVEQDIFDDDVRRIPTDYVSEHALKVVNASDLLTVELPNSRVPGEPSEAAAPTSAAGAQFKRLGQFINRETLEHSMLREQVVQLVFWNL